MRSTRPTAPALAAALFLLGGGFAAVLLDRPPAPAPASAPTHLFSAGRAQERLSQLAARPHPTGSAEHRRVREGLQGALASLGLRVEHQQALAIRSRAAGTVRAAWVENLLARIPGTASTGAVLLAAHYDSVPAAPGAADAGSGVVALLETARALLASPRLRNDVILLLTDGEELGLLGASAFVEQHPWAKEVRLALNFEARGTSGPSFMFETSPGNAGVVETWARTAPTPSGSSLTYEVYRRMPNDTDFTVFRSLGVPGLNFAFVGDWVRYHTPLDSLPNLDRRSLQHHGATALALARAFGSLDLAQRADGDLVYFSLPATGLVARYPTWMALAGGTLALLIAAASAVFAVRRRESRGLGILAATVVFAAMTGLAGLAGYHALDGLNWLHRRWLSPGHVMLSAPYAAALALLAAAVWLTLYALLRRWFSASTLALGVALVLSAASAAAAWFLPGASYVTLWPALALGLAIPIALLGVRRHPAIRAVTTVLVVLLAAPTLAVLVPLIPLLFATMGLAPVSGAAMAVLALVAAGSLAPQFEIVNEGRRYWPAVASFALVVMLMGWGMATTRYSPAMPRKAPVLYVLDGDTRVANWAVQGAGGTAWATQFLGRAPRDGRPTALVAPWSTSTGQPGFLHAAAPVLDLKRPELMLTGSTTSSDGRRLRLRAIPGGEGHSLSIWIGAGRVVDAKVEGRPTNRESGSASSTWSLDLVNAPAGGVDLTLDVRGQGPVAISILDRTSGLPPGAGRFEPRPPEIVPEGLGDQTTVRRYYSY